MPLTYSLPLVPLLIALNAFFVAAEYSVVAIRPQQMALMLRRRPRAGRAIERLKANPASAIGAIQVCITMTNLLLGWIAEPAMSAVLIRVLGPVGSMLPLALFTALAFVLSFVIVTLLTVVFSELLPKALTLRYVISAAALTAVPVLMISRAIRPLVWLMNAMANTVTRPLGLGRVDELESENVTVAELRLMATQASEQGTLPERIKGLILNSLELTERTGRAIMVPRVKVSFLDLQRPLAENRRIMRDRLHSRFPVCDGGMDKVMGVVQTKEFLTLDVPADESDSRRLLDVAQPPTFMPAGLPLDHLLRTFQQDASQMLFLVDEYGGIEGIVTLRDVLDEVVGFVGDSIALAGGRAADEELAPLIIPADTPIHELARLLAHPDWARGRGVSTVGGLITAELGRIPRRGEEVELEGMILRAVASSRKRVRRIQVRRAPQQPRDDQAQ